MARPRDDAVEGTSATAEGRARPPAATPRADGWILGWKGALLLFAMLLVLSARLLAKEAADGFPVQEDWTLLYQAATLGFSYPEFGAVRRGLGGTIVRMTGLPLLGGTVAFHLLSAAFVSAAGCAVLARMEGGVHRKVAYAIVLLVCMAFWAEDAGRTDMAVAGCVAMAAMSMGRARALAAALWLVAGLAIHENAFLYGLPIVATLLVGRAVPLSFADRSVRAACGVVAVVAVGYALIDRLPHADVASMASAVRARLPTHDLVDWAIYFALGGMRGVKASMCQNWTVDPNYALHFVSGLVVIALAAFTLNGRDRAGARLGLWAALPPFVVLSVLANDQSRWVILACFNLWLAAALRPARVDWERRSVFAVHVACACCLLLLVHPKRPMRIDNAMYSPSPLIEALSIRLGGPATPGPEAALARCDAQWRDVVEGRAGASDRSPGPTPAATGHRMP